MSTKIPYLRKKASTLLTLSAIALLLSSPMLFFNVLQPVQAQTLMTFKTLGPARGTDPATRIDFNLIFDVYGTTNSANPQSVKITGGTVQLQQDPENNGQIYNGTTSDGAYTNDSKGEPCANVYSEGPCFYFFTSLGQTGYTISSACSTSPENNVNLSIEDLTVQAAGEVECSTGGGGNTASSSSSMTGTSARDSDGDGIPDSSDRCTHNSNHRCFKEDTSTHQEQQPSSSSSGTGNQTG